MTTYRPNMYTAFENLDRIFRLGRRGRIIFIPPHFAQQVVEQGEEVALRDRFGHQRLREGVYTPGEIDRKWSEEIEADFAKWREDQE